MPDHRGKGVKTKRENNQERRLPPHVTPNSSGKGFGPVNRELKRLGGGRGAEWQKN